MLVRLFGTEMKVPVAGFQTRAWLPKSCPSQARISPVGSRFACTATIGQATGAAHWPEVEPVGVPDRDGHRGARRAVAGEVGRPRLQDMASGDRGRRVPGDAEWRVP